VQLISKPKFPSQLANERAAAVVATAAAAVVVTTTTPAHPVIDKTDLTEIKFTIEQEEEPEEPQSSPSLSPPEQQQQQVYELQESSTIQPIPVQKSPQLSEPEQETEQGQDHEHYHRPYRWQVNELMDCYTSSRILSYY